MCFFDTQSNKISEEKNIETKTVCNSGSGGGGGGVAAAAYHVI